MHSDKSPQALLDIQDNILRAQDFVGSLDQKAFAQNLQAFYATTRCLEIISEASRRLDASIRDRHPDQAWRKIMDAGNYYRRNYDNVAEKFVWKTVKESLPPLLIIVQEELDENKRC